jgi:hypothetical protein
MTTSQKAATSLLIVVLLFGGFSVLAFTGLFDLTEEVLLLPATMKFILLFALFLTTYLIIFLLFNLRQDPLVVVQNRLKQLQISLIEQFYDSKGEADWARWILELEHRREEIRALLKRGVKAGSGSDSGEMDILINRSWDELLTMLGSKRETGLDEEKIASILNKLLDARTGASLQSPAAAGDGITGLLNKATEKIEILDELDDAERNGASKIAASDVDILASQIEFNHDIKPETAGDGLFNEELEVVSPFSTMVFDSYPERSTEERSTEERSSDTVDDETDISEGLPLISTPFSGIMSGAVIETLETFNAGEERQIDGAVFISDDDSIIREREGIHYISEHVLAPSSEFAATLNRGLKDLVDEVTK